MAGDERALLLSASLEGIPHWGTSRRLKGSEVAEMNTSRATSAVAGTQTAGLMSGGETDDAQAKTEDWNGTAWTEVADLSTARGTVAGGNAGTSSSTWLQGGYIPGQSPNAYSTVLTEEWEFVHAIKTVTTS